MKREKIKKLQIKLAKKSKVKDIDYFYIQQYQNWRTDLKNKDFESTFFILYKDFDVHLRDISPGALKLYLFYGFHAKNETGLLWHGVEKISEYFGVSERTINNWNSELEERGLISRVLREKGRNKTTYLLPFSLNLLYLQDISITENEAFRSVYGEQDRALHLFQWRKSSEKNSEEYDEPYHTLVLIYKKTYNTGRHAQFTAFEYPIQEICSNKIIDTQTLNEDISIFESDLVIPHVKAPISGFAIRGKFNLKLKHILYAFIKELIDPQTDFSQYKTVKILNRNESEASADEM